MTDKQLNLFSVADVAAPYRITPEPQLEMRSETLLKWKQKIFHYQESVRNCPATTQHSLLVEINPVPDHWDAEKIDPFNLTPKPWDFYRERYDPLKESASNIYFVIDRAMPLLLYVGETKLSIKQRWQGEHDCKQYIDAYVSLNRKYGFEIAINMAFNVSVPGDRRRRLALERDLILRWRSPFNKECWQYWGQPFQRYQ